MKECPICLGTGFYINSRGVKSDQPCNVCNPEAFAKLIQRKGNNP